MASAFPGPNSQIEPHGRVRQYPVSCTHLILRLHAGKEVACGVAKGLKTLNIVIQVRVVAWRAIIRSPGQVSLAFPLDLLEGRGRLGLLEAALVGNLSFLAMVAGPLAVALRLLERFS